MRLVDISTPIDASHWEPDPVEHTILNPRDGAEHLAAEMRAHFGVELNPDEFPDGEFLSLDQLQLTTHTGTHVDAPSHYGSRARYQHQAPRNVEELPLEPFFGPGLVLDLRNCTSSVAGVEDLEAAMTQAGQRPEAGDIVLLNTGASAWVGTPRYFDNFTGLDGPATHRLLDLGVKVIGTDAFSLDAPFKDIITRYRETEDRTVLWPAHVIGRDREYYQLERLGGLERLPPHGFRVACFPVKIARAGAGWTRAVAIFE